MAFCNVKDVLQLVKSITASTYPLSMSDWLCTKCLDRTTVIGRQVFDLKIHPL